MMSNDVFTKHQHDPVPLHRNTMPVAECGVHSAIVGGKPCKAIDVPILSCASVWLRVQKEAEAWITVDGKLIADPIQRNRRIQIIDAFESTEQNQIARSVRIMAEHEQLNILQSAIYDSFLMRRALDANQLSWAIGSPSGEIAATGAVR
jgi:hypothetical protein